MLASFRTRLRHRLAAATATAVLAASVPVYAETSAAEREQARKLAAEGFEALQRKDYAAAEDRFRRADALVHAPTLVVDHARALTGLGRLVEAHERYELVLREGVSPSSPWQWRLAHADAERELEALKPRLAWLTLRVIGPREPTVLVDNRNVPLAALGVRRATDPGTHSVSVSAKGYASKEEIVSLDEGETVSLEIELEADPEAVEAPEPVAQPVPEAPVEVEPTPERDNTIAYVVLGIGGVGLAAGAVTGALALGARSDLESQCPERVCRPRSRVELDEHENDIDEYRLWGTLSGVSFAVGLAAAATGVTLLLWGGSDNVSASSAPKSRVTAYAGLGRVGVAGAF